MAHDVTERIRDAMVECLKHNVDWASKQYLALQAAKAEIERLEAEIKRLRNETLRLRGKKVHTRFYSSSGND